MLQKMNDLLDVMRTISQFFAEKNFVSGENF